MSTSLPPNVHVSTHPCLQAKLSQLRDSNTKARETKALVHEISLILGVEALASGLNVKQGPIVRPLTSSITSLPTLIFTTEPNPHSKTHSRPHAFHPKSPPHKLY